MICFNRNTVRVWNYIFDRDPFPDLDPPIPRFFCQPLIELIAADNAQGVAPWHPHVKSFGLEIKMNSIHVHMRHFAHVEPETLKDHLCVEHESAGAQLEAWILRFFQDQDAGSCSVMGSMMQYLRKE
jgi:hypothetical protein